MKPLVLQFGSHPDHASTCSQQIPTWEYWTLIATLFKIFAMDVSHYHADSPPSVVPLLVKPHFEALTNEQKLYAHHISK